VRFFSTSFAREICYRLRFQLSDLMTIRKPLHDHHCLICSGKYPCWTSLCKQHREFVSDDRTENAEEESKAAANTPC
jgi:hypothetical protein